MFATGVCLYSLIYGQEWVQFAAGQCAVVRLCPGEVKAYELSFGLPSRLSLPWSRSTTILQYSKESRGTLKKDELFSK